MFDVKDFENIGKLYNYWQKTNSRRMTEFKSLMFDITKDYNCDTIIEIPIFKEYSLKVKTVIGITLDYRVLRLKDNSYSANPTGQTYKPLSINGDYVGGWFTDEPETSWGSNLINEWDAYDEKSPTFKSKLCVLDIEYSLESLNFIDDAVIEINYDWLKSKVEEKIQLMNYDKLYDFNRILELAEIIAIDIITPKSNDMTDIPVNDWDKKFGNLADTLIKTTKSVTPINNRIEYLVRNLNFKYDSKISGDVFELINHLKDMNYSLYQIECLIKFARYAEDKIFHNDYFDSVAYYPTLSNHVLDLLDLYVKPDFRATAPFIKTIITAIRESEQEDREKTEYQSQVSSEIKDFENQWCSPINANILLHDYSFEHKAIIAKFNVLSRYFRNNYLKNFNLINTNRAMFGFGWDSVSAAEIRKISENIIDYDLEIERMFTVDGNTCFEPCYIIEVMIKKLILEGSLDTDDLQSVIAAYEVGGRIGVKLTTPTDSDVPQDSTKSNILNEVDAYGSDLIEVENETVRDSLKKARQHISEFV